MKQSLFKDAMILTAITLIAGLALGFVYEITKAPIAKAEADAVAKAYQTVFANATTFDALENFDTQEASSYVQSEGYTEDDIDQVVVAKDTSGTTLGYVITVTSHAGYGGDITFSVGITTDGNINGYSITSISETAGLGMKATEEKFSSQFANIPAATYTVTKSAPAGDLEVEAISGATITSNAMTGGVNAAVCYFQKLTGGAANE
ncbi:MAG: RnfABCDGE type electron transport complex subunit G [Lachnospiraceae bacterium]|nr:RnfABCDGE type electron transport complex subunit G [Lachnospiraceae bacterium]